jgi:hypothetical protein
MDIEKTMQFILDMQAKLEASAAGHEDRIAKLESSVAALTSSVATVTDLVGRVAQAEIRLVERMDSGFQKLTELHADTEYKLNALITTVDKLVGRNGHSA